jgi:hypothetical protein
MYRAVMAFYQTFLTRFICNFKNQQPCRTVTVTDRPPTGWTDYGRPAGEGECDDAERDDRAVSLLGASVADADDAMRSVGNAQGAPPELL